MTCDLGALSRGLSSRWTLAIGAVLLACGVLQAQTNVTTQRYDGFRTSSNLQETILNPTSVSPSTFGLLWTYPVDGDVYAQPLYVANVNIAGAGVHNVVYIVTMHDVVYAFDADNPGAPLWERDLRNPAAGITAYLSANFTNPKWATPIGDAFGIHSTPVIDPTANLMYAVAQTSEPSGIVYRLHAFDIRSGVEPIPATVIQANSQGITFSAAMQNQRPALLLSGGQIYIGFGGRPDDDTPYWGWLMTYSAATLAQTGVFLVNSTSYGGAIWQGGGGPAVDENGNVYAVSGNGFGNGDGVTNYSESLMKFSFSSGLLSLADWFTPANSAALDASDYDLSTNGPMVIPGAGLTAFGSKTADFYLASNASLGKVTTNNTGLVQSMHIGTGYPAQFGQSNLIIGLALWPRGQGSILYAWPAADKLFSFALTGNQFAQTGSSTVQSISAPGAGMVLTANGTQSGTGILWAEMSLVPNGYTVGNPGVLRAFNAENLTTELWDSNLNATRDGIAAAAKFAVPTVVNGRVYAPTFNGLVQVYGLLASQNFKLAASPTTLTVSAATSGTSTVTAAPLSGFNGTVTYSATGAPAGVTVSCSPVTTTGAGQTTVTFSVASTVAGGATYPIVITGTSGTLSQSTTVSLTIPAHLAPSISITAPANNTTFAVGSNIALAAQASATGATVSQVAFLQGTVTLATLTQAPFTFTWSNVAAGTYQLTAKVTDSLGSATTSSPLTIVVAPVSVTLTPAAVTLTTNQQEQFAATVLNSSNTAVTWSTPSAGAITAAGLYTAPASITGQQTVTITAVSAADSTKSATATVTLVPPPTFSLSMTPAAVTLAAGSSTTSQVVVSPLNGFTGSPTFSVSGLPANVTGSFSPTSSVTTSTLTLTPATNAVPGTYPLTIMGTSGTVSQSASLSMTVTAASSGAFVSVDLTSVSNVYAIWNDGTTTLHGAVDGLGDAYSANLLGNTLTASGVTFTFGAPATANASSSLTIPLPAGNFTSLKFLGAGNNGGGYPLAQSSRNQVNQNFIVTYTDGSTTTFTQSLSDLGSPQNYAGETVVSTMSYIDNPKGAKASGPWYLYGYSFTLNSTKTVKSVTLPNNRGVVVLAMALVSAAAAPSPTSVSLTSVYNVDGIFNDGARPTYGGLDNQGYAYSENLLGTNVSALGVTFPLGHSGTSDAVYGKTISLPSGNFGNLTFLATAVNGNQTGQAFVVTYTDGSTTTFTQSLSDWVQGQNYPGETVASATAYRVTPTGGKQDGPWHIYGYSLTLNTAKTVKSITLPNNRNVVVLAMSLQ